MGTMASSTHQFGVLDLIRAGLQDLGAARTLLDELRADGIDDDRLCLLMKTLEQTCEPDIALRNLVDIIKALQSQGRDFHQVITDDAGLVRLVTVLGAPDPYQGDSGPHRVKSCIARDIKDYKAMLETLAVKTGDHK